MQEIEDEKIEFYEGSDTTFTLNGKQIVIPANLDTFNHYRSSYRRLAKVCADKSVERYIATINDYDSFMEMFLKVYDEYLQIPVQNAVDILISSGVYTYTTDSFKAEHIDSFHLAVDDYTTMEKSEELTKDNNYKLNNSFANALNKFAGSKFNHQFTQDILKGTLDGLVEENKEITAEQKAELFHRIKPENLFNRVFADYCNVFMTLANILRKNGKDIWYLEEQDTSKLDAVFENLSNPNFPEDKIAEVLFELILTNPYKAEYYEFMKEKYGDTEEVNLISEYFCYPECVNPVYREEDFPKIEVDDNISMATEQPENIKNVESETGEQGMFSSIMDKVDTAQIKKGLKIGAGIGMSMLASSALFGSNKKQSAETDESKREKMRQKEMREAEYQRKHEAAKESQRQWNAVKKANEERRRKGQPELPLPPRSWY